MMNERTYRRATAKDIPGHEICRAGYVDCHDPGGSHYHCAKCGRVTGMMGCYTSVVYIGGKSHYLKDTNNKPMWVFRCQPEYQEAVDKLNA